MSTKPATLPRWADVGGALATPASGKLDLGWLPGEIPPAQHENWLHFWTYRWAEYLRDGALQGAHSFDSTVSIADTLTMGAGKHIVSLGRRAL